MLCLQPRVLTRSTCARSFSTTSSRLLEGRPTTAPKQTPDVKSIRRAAHLYKQNAQLRNYLQHQDSPQRIAELAETSASIAKSTVVPRRELKELEGRLGSLKAKKDEDGVNRIREQILPLRNAVDELDGKRHTVDEELHRLALALPNLTSANTPQDGQPKLLSYLNYDETSPQSFDEGADHSIIGQKLGILDFIASATASGWGFYYLLNEAALLEHALVQHALTTAMRHGWRIATPPSLVYSHIADACGFQPRDANDEQQIWQVSQSEKDIGKPKRSLAATAEIPLAAIYASKDIPESQLPVKLVGSSRCYRAEAGSRGVDTKGLYRVHEFTKVEMFAWTNTTGAALDDDESWLKHSTEVFEEMLNIQTEILSSLELPCRVLEMPTSDLGASAYRKIDIEAIFPSRMKRDDGWGELSSVSMCTDYQSRRLDTRIRDASGGRSRFPHTINGTALAVPRVIAAILEHGWSEAEQCVYMPQALRPLLGFSKIGPVPK